MKFLILFVFVLLAIAFDGTLAKDIFDYRISTFTDWVLVIMIVGVVLTISWANSAKND